MLSLFMYEYSVDSSREILEGLVYTVQYYEADEDVGQNSNGSIADPL